MSAPKKRNSHSAELKARVDLEALRGEKTINEIGQEYGVHPVQVGQWKKAIQEQMCSGGGLASHDLCPAKAPAG